MKALDIVQPTIKEKFQDHPNFYRVYMEENKLKIAFSDMVMAVTSMAWDIYFVEILHRKNPTETSLAYAKVCKNRVELFSFLKKARDAYEKPNITKPEERIGFKVDIKHILEERFKEHPKFVKIFSGYEKLFIVFQDILILVEPIGGSFYNWELFEREGELEVKHRAIGVKIGFEKIVDILFDLREKSDKSG